MKPKLAKSYEELIAAYYGIRPGVSSEPATVEELFAGYYGKPGTTDMNKTRAKAAAVFSLRCDDGETLQQHRKKKASRQKRLVMAASIDNDLKESVVQDVSPVREVEVNLVPGAPAALTPLPSVAEPSPVPSRQAERGPVPQGPGPTPNQSEPLREPAKPANGNGNGGAAKASPRTSDDEFEADLQSILTGRKVFDPISGKTVEKDKIADARATPQAPPPPPPAAGGDGQAIFDRIAQSMQYANAYDLGTVELQNRFTDFDRMADLQGRAKKDTARAEKAPPGLVVPKTPTKPDGQEFLEDLDAIRTHQATPPAPPVAEEFSLVGDIAEALYDTGEHVLAAETMFPDKFVVGKAPGVTFSYGQLIAMADMFESVNQLIATDAGELKKVKALVEKSTRYYKSGKAGANVTNEEWDQATAARYLRLAEDNYDHFAPNILFRGAPFAKGPSRFGNHKTAWERHHKWALEEARKDPNMAVSGYFAQWPLTINAFGDHFLTDAFAAGHVVNKEVVVDYYKASFYSSGSLTADGKAFFDKVSVKAFTGDVAKKFSGLESAKPYDAWWNVVNWNPNINSASRFAALLSGIAEKEPDRIGNLAIKALHDKLNKDGITVENKAGSGSWQLTGDGYLTAKTLEVMRQAVEQSVANVLDPAIRAGTIDFSAYFDKVWLYVPRLTAAAEASVDSLMVSYVTPTSSLLVDAAAKLIGQEVDTLIKALLVKGVLKKA